MPILLVQCTIVMCMEGVIWYQCAITILSILGRFHHVIRGTADVTDSRHSSLFTFVSTVSEKLENQNKSYL